MTSSIRQWLGLLVAGALVALALVAAAFAQTPPVFLTTLKAFSPQSCQSKLGDCHGQFEWTATTADGSFVFDQAVRVDLVRLADDVVVLTRYCPAASGVTTGGGSPWLYVDANDQQSSYRTFIKRSDFGATAPGAYALRIILWSGYDTKTLIGQIPLSF